MRLKRKRLGTEGEINSESLFCASIRGYWKSQLSELLLTVPSASRVVTTAGRSDLSRPLQLIRVVVPSLGLMNFAGYLFFRHATPSRSTIVVFGLNPTPLT